MQRQVGANRVLYFGVLGCVFRCVLVLESSAEEVDSRRRKNTEVGFLFKWCRVRVISGGKERKKTSNHLLKCEKYIFYIAPLTY